MLQDSYDYDDNSGLMEATAPGSLDVPTYYYVDRDDSPAMSPAEFQNEVIQELGPSVAGQQIVFAPASAPLAGAPGQVVVLEAGKRKLQQVC